MLKCGRLEELRSALELIADWNGTTLDWEAAGFIDESGKTSTKKTRRPDKAENVMRITGLPDGT